MLRNALILTLVGALLCGSLGCQKEAEAGPPPDPNKMVWRQMAMVLATEGIDRVAVLRVEDKVGKAPDVERQVQQSVLEELTTIPDLMILETDPVVLATTLKGTDLDLAIGIPAPTAMDLCQALNVQAIIYVSVENTEYDANLKMYSGASGTVIFSKTLEDLELPGAEPPLDLMMPTPEGTTETVANLPDA